MSVALRPGDGCLIPIPQYPLYTATLSYLSATPLPYYLQESSRWTMGHSDLEDAVSKARSSNTPVKALVIINPGNPTGACLDRKAMEAVVQLCYDQGLLLMADEVYQANIFDPHRKPFISFKKVLMEMPEPVKRGVELVSFQSISKGFSGECGRRGGWFEAVNLDPEVMEQVYKMASVSLCSPVSGQVSRCEPLRTSPSHDPSRSALRPGRRRSPRFPSAPRRPILRPVPARNVPHPQQPPGSITIHV